MSKLDRIRKALLRAEPHCRKCSKAGAQVPAITVSAIVPLDQGGEIRRSNFQPACSRHATFNLRKANALARILRKRMRQREAAARIKRGKSK